MNLHMEGELLLWSHFPYHMMQAFTIILVMAILTACKKYFPIIDQIQVAQLLRLLDWCMVCLLARSLLLLHQDSFSREQSGECVSDVSEWYVLPWTLQQF